MLLLTIAGIAVLMDLYEMRIKNSWIICSFIAGLIYSIWSGNRYGIVQFVLGTAVPIVLLFAGFDKLSYVLFQIVKSLVEAAAKKQDCQR